MHSGYLAVDADRSPSVPGDRNRSSKRKRHSPPWEEPLQAAHLRGAPQPAGQQHGGHDRLAMAPPSPGEAPADAFAAAFEVMTEVETDAGADADVGLGFKYNEVVRDKAARMKMHGEDCAECEKYHRFVFQTEGQKGLDRVLKYTRHKCVHTKVQEDPEFMWDMGFPNTQEDPQQQHLLKCRAQRTELDKRKAAKAEEEARARLSTPDAPARAAAAGHAELLGSTISRAKPKSSAASTSTPWLRAKKCPDMYLADSPSPPARAKPQQGLKSKIKKQAFVEDFFNAKRSQSGERGTTA